MTGPIPVAPPPPAKPTPDLVYVSFTAEINPNTTESLIATCTNLVNNGVKKIYLLFSTPGGLVSHGMTLFNTLKGLPVELTIHNSGNVDSIGNVIFLAGAKRYACKHSTFMFHGVGFNGQAGVRLEEKNLKETLASLHAEQKRIGDVIAETTGIIPDEVSKLFLEQQTKDSAFAVSKRIVHEVREIQVPAGAPIVSLVFQRQGV